MFRKPILTLLSVLLLAVGLIASTHASYAASTIVVNSLDDNPHWTGTCSLRDAILSANSDQAQDGCTAGNGADVIEFAPELTGGTIVLNGESLTVFDDVTIAGNITLDAQYRSRIFMVENHAELTLDGLTLTHGRARFGGALYVYRGHVTLRNMTFDRNQASIDGGAIHATHPRSLVTVINSHFTRNRSEGLGGAIDLFETHGVIYNSVFEHNSAQIEGGAISAIRSTLSSSNNTYRYNNSLFGGVICAVDSRLIMNSDTLVSNWAGLVGGGVVASGGVFQLRGSTVSSNSSEGDGGAIGLMNSVNATISNAVLRGNQAVQFGGGVSNHGGTLFVGGVTLDGNSAERGSGFYQQSGETSFAETTFTNNVAQWDGGIVQEID